LIPCNMPVYPGALRFARGRRPKQILVPIETGEGKSV
jgi:hypothetical protein